MGNKVRVRRFKRKLAAGVMGAAALAAADVQAVPIYVDVADVTISPDSSRRDILLNLSNLVNPDATLPDASISWGTPPEPMRPSPLTLTFTGLNNMAMALPNPLRAGDLVLGSPPDPAMPSPFVGSFNLATGASSDPLQGEWVGLSNAFLGWQVDVPGGSPHVGWLRVSLDTAGNFTLHDFAIESEPNASIRAGQTAAMPEAGTLALLALGAVGLALWRPRRRSV